MKHIESSDQRLKSQWCIIDKEGNEKKVFKDVLHSPYIVEGSCIYVIDKKYYNIETDKCYGYYYNSIESTEYLFLKKGYGVKEVMKINKINGDFEIIK